VLTHLRILLQGLVHTPDTGFLGKREYHSNITGEHSYFIVTVSDNQVKSFRDPIDVLVIF